MKRIRVHGLEHVRAALEAARALGCAVELVSPAANFAGIGWWRELMARAAAEFPDVAFSPLLDCGPSAGLALAAIRDGAGPLALTAAPPVAEKVADIAKQAGSRVECISGGGVALDLLGMPAPGVKCREYLGAEETGA